MGREDEEYRRMAADCSGGQSLPCAVAPRGRKEGSNERNRSEVNSRPVMSALVDEYFELQVLTTVSMKISIF
jgi:hypothetical protein